MDIQCKVMRENSQLLCVKTEVVENVLTALLALCDKYKYIS